MWLFYFVYKWQPCTIFFRARTSSKRNVKLKSARYQVHKKGKVTKKEPSYLPSPRRDPQKRSEFPHDIQKTSIQQSEKEAAFKMEKELDVREEQLDWGQLEVDPGSRRDSGGGDGSMDQTGFLLQRLQELKQWQKEQEMRLIREQQEQMEQLKAQGDAGESSHKFLIEMPY